MTTWMVIATIGLTTYLVRASMFVLVGRRALPSWVDRPMAVAAPAAVSAIVGAMVLTHDGRLDPIDRPQLVAVVAAFLTVRRTGNVMHAFAIGLPVVWMLSALGW